MVGRAEKSLRLMILLSMPSMQACGILAYKRCSNAWSPGFGLYLPTSTPRLSVTLEEAFNVDREAKSQRKTLDMYLKHDASSVLCFRPGNRDNGLTVR